MSKNRKIFSIHIEYIRFMLDIQRVKKVIAWLVFSKKIGNNKDLAQKMGYTESSFSQIINGKVPLSSRFIKRLSIIDESINLNWLLTGEGAMLREESTLLRKILEEPTHTQDAPLGNVNRKKIPLYDTYSVGGTSMIAPNDPVTAPTEWIDAGDWFIDATAAMHHYGDSMIEYPSGCILALKEISDKELIIWGKNYVIETDEYRITKRLQRSKDPKYVIAYSTNEEKYQDGTLIHQPIDIPKSAIRRLALVLGYVVKEHCSARFYSINRG